MAYTRHLDVTCKPRTLHTDEIVIVKGLIMEDRRVKVYEIAEVTDIAKKALFMK
jgi:hypothetical protein